MTSERDAVSCSLIHDIINACSRRGLALSLVPANGRGPFATPLLPASSHQIDAIAPLFSAPTVTASNGIISYSVPHARGTLHPILSASPSLPRHLGEGHPSTTLKPNTSPLPASPPAFAARSHATASLHGINVTDHNIKVDTGSRFELDGAAGAFPGPSFSTVGSGMEAQAMREAVRRGARITAISEPKSGQDGRFKKTTVHNGGGSVSLDTREVVRRATAPVATPSTSSRTNNVLFPSHSIAFGADDGECESLRGSTTNGNNRRVAPRMEAEPHSSGSSSSLLGASKTKQPQGKKVSRHGKIMSSPSHVQAIPPQAKAARSARSHNFDHEDALRRNGLTQNGRAKGRGVNDDVDSRHNSNKRQKQLGTRRQASLIGFVVDDEAPIVWDSDAAEVFRRDQEEEDEEGEEESSESEGSGGSIWSSATSERWPPFYGSKYGSAIWPAPSRRERPLTERFWMYDHSRMKNTRDSG